MRVSVFGLGYVGAVTCGCFAHDGMDVIGVDINSDKVDILNGGDSPIIEPEIGDLIASGVASGRLRATTESGEAVAATDVSIISVGTPSNPNGSLSLRAVERVSEDIGRGIAAKKDRHLVVVRSTMLPGSVRDTVVPALERASGKRVDDGFGVTYNPEFLREGRSVRDHYEPPYILVGSSMPVDGQQTVALYDGVRAQSHVTNIETAEMLKYVCNAFHALKITFANEVGMLSQACGVDSREVMSLLCDDTKLNISSRYLRPGFAFGGSCLPKDVRAMLYGARMSDVELPLIQGIIVSNRQQIERAVERVLQFGRRQIGLLGLSFKEGTDDLRESPLVQLAEALLGKGLELRIHDAEVSLSRLVGANRLYIEEQIPHLAALLVPSVDDLVAKSEVLVVGHNDKGTQRLPSLCRTGQVVIDLAGIAGLSECPGIDYQGITW